MNIPSVVVLVGPKRLQNTLSQLALALASFKVEFHSGVDAKIFREMGGLVGHNIDPW